MNYQEARLEWLTGIAESCWDEADWRTVQRYTRDALLAYKRFSTVDMILKEVWTEATGAPPPSLEETARRMAVEVWGEPG